MHGADLFADAPERPAVHCPVDRTVVRPVAALCVAPNSGYKNMDAVECYDMARDVRTFTGGMPVVAHPPCRTWSAYTAHQAKAPPGEKELGLLCAEWLRREGGVLEHPAHSRLFEAARLPMPGQRLGDLYTMLVFQEQVMSKHQRAATCPALAEWLVRAARKALAQS